MFSGNSTPDVEIMEESENIVPNQKVRLAGSFQTKQIIKKLNRIQISFAKVLSTFDLSVNVT